MRSVLDSSAFFSQKPFEGELFTTPLVVAELKDISARCRFEALSSQGLQVQEPGEVSKKSVLEAAKRSGDEGVISRTDLEILALALEIGAQVISDDYAVQNIALEVGIAIEPIQLRSAARIHWKFRCIGCGKYFPHTGECPVCGSAIKRKLK